MTTKTETQVPTAERLVGDLPLRPEEILSDYRLAARSRHASVIGRREVLNGKAKFGIFGDGKELAQLAMARASRPGDWRSGYYRDQTWLLALGVLTLEQHFAQLFAETDPGREPHMGGRSMNGHFSTRYLDGDGEWLDQTARFNSSADVSPTASQMPRAVGLAYASVVYRKLGRPGGQDERLPDSALQESVYRPEISSEGHGGHREILLR